MDSLAKQLRMRDDTDEGETGEPSIRRAAAPVGYTGLYPRAQQLDSSPTSPSSVSAWWPGAVEPV